MSKRLMALLSIVERDKGTKLIKVMESIGIRMNFQCVGFGTAPTEMMATFGLGTNDKDIIISLTSQNKVRHMMANFGTTFESHNKFGGIMIIMETSAASRVLTELLSYNSDTNNQKGNDTMKNEYHNNLIIVALNEGYSDAVMQAARKAGATGGTVIKGRLADVEFVAELENSEIDEEREILCILAPVNTSKQIMAAINEEFGINSKANGIVTAIPTTKAYRI